MNSIYCKEIEVKGLNEDICFYLYENSGDERHKAMIGLDIESAEEIYKILGQEIAKLKTNQK